MRVALTIAGSDSSAGAGIQADLKTFAALGVYGTCAVTAITAQSTTGVTAVFPLSADLVTAQIEAVAGDIHIHSTKIGMLGNAAIAEAAAAAIDELELPLVVVDPVIASKNGERLLDNDGVQTLLAELIPRSRVVTPNIPEAEALSGHRIHTKDDVREAARRIHALGPTAVVITGGHATGPDSVDLLFDGHEFHEFHTPRVETTDTHGTGCTFASAVAAYLALGRGLPEAVEGAQRYVAGAIAHAHRLGHGHGPINHFWRLEHRNLEL
jgi:hydroxymethylpyrimidine/phosphomethylpyrimidine kinase